MRTALIVGIVAAVASVAGLFVSGAAQFFQAYLFAFLFWLSISLGSLIILLLHFSVASRWGLTVRRMAEAAGGSIWVMAVLFIPIIFGMQSLYPWSQPATVAANTTLQAKAFYLNVPFFLIRAVIFFGAWILLSIFANRMSTQLSQNPAGTPEFRGKLQGLGTAGLIIIGLTMTFAAIDWIQSLQPIWTSTAFGIITIVGEVLTAMAFLILMLNLFPGLALGRRWNFATTPIPYQDLGALLLVMVMSWAYVAFFQLLIVWAGNIPHEVIWYANRVQGGWSVVGILIALLQFALPFVILLSIRARHNLRVLAWLSGMLLFSYLLNMFWHVKPAFSAGAFAIGWLDIVLPIAVGGIWLAGFFYTLNRRPALTLPEQSALHLTEGEKAAS